MLLAQLHLSFNRLQQGKTDSKNNVPRLRKLRVGKTTSHFLRTAQTFVLNRLTRKTRDGDARLQYVSPLSI